MSNITCPKCQGTADITCGQYSDKLKDVVNEHQAFCHHCSHEWDINTGKAIRRGGKGKSVTGVERCIPGVHLKPTVCQDEDAIMQVALTGTRKRPVVAINHAGQYVVCAYKTARKHGWAVQGKMMPAATEEAPVADQFEGLI